MAATSQRLVLGVFLILLSTLGLVLEWMQLPVEHQHWLCFVLVVMRHCVESLSVVQAEEEECTGSDQMLLEGHLGHVGGRKLSFAGEQGVFVCVKLLFDVSAEHLIN